MSPRTVAEKLGVRNGYRVLIVGAPTGYSLGALPPDSKLLTKPAKDIDLAQIFVSSMDELKKKLVELKPNLKPAVPLWVTYPKGTSKVTTDLNRDIIGKYASTVGFQPVAMFAVDETWSALRLKCVGATEKGRK